VGLVAFITLVVMLLLSVPVAIALAVAALFGLLYSSPEFLITLPQKFVAGLDSFPLLAIPLFVLAGSLMSHGGMARRIVDMAMVFVGRIPGGLALMVIVSTCLFSGISGSPSANTAAIGSVAIPAMDSRKYPKDFATAVFAAAGGVSTLVPPAIDLIIIGVVAGMSIGGLFAAGILPAAFNALALMALTFFFATRMNLPLEPPMPWRQKLKIIWNGTLPILMIVIILGGIYAGIFTPTEASAVAVVYGFIVSFFIYRELTLEDIPKVLLHTAKLTGTVMLVLATASMFSFVLVFERIPHLLAELITTYAYNWIVFILFVHVVFFVLGMIMDALPPIIILTPILVPVAVELGMEPIHIGILIAANVGLGMISPPVGICLYVACGIANTKIEDVVPRLIPYLVILAITLMLITFFPSITLFLPRLLGYAGG
jgi:C4-dicarboxylate transporter DctM subunit